MVLRAVLFPGLEAEKTSFNYHTKSKDCNNMTVTNPPGPVCSEAHDQY